MKRLAILAAIFLGGAALALFLARVATGDPLSCSTDTAAAVAAATVTNLGTAWSSPANPDPLWDVNMPALNMDVSVYAPDDAHARANAKANLDAQVAALGCATTTTTTTQATTTTAPTVSTATVTTTATVAGPAAVYFVPTPAPPASTVAATTPASVAPVAPSVVVSITVNLKPLTCSVAKKKPAPKAKH